MRFRTFCQIAFVSVAMLGLGGCDTVNQSLSDTGDWFSRNNPFRSDENAAAKPVETGTAETTPPATASCIPVSVVEDLKMLSQFSDDMAPRAENNISSVSIDGVSSKCTTSDKNYAVDLDITFDGTLGPKAHEGGSNQSEFSYPYFLAVTLPDGTIVTKEVFGVTMSYPRDKNSIVQHEHMRQIIPIQSQAGQPQQIVIGFQLTEAQLSYNRSLEGKQNVAAGPVAPDATPAATAKKEVKKPVKKKAKPRHKKVVKHTPAPAVKKETPPAEPAATETTPVDKTEVAPEPATTAPESETAAPAPGTDESAAPAATDSTATAPANPPEVEATPPAQPPSQAAPTDSSSTTTAAPAQAQPEDKPANPDEPQEPQQPSSSGTENLMATPPADSGTGTGTGQ